MLGAWFGGERHIDLVQSVETDTIGDIVRVGYRFRAMTPAGPAIVEQSHAMRRAGRLRRWLPRAGRCDTPSCGLRDLPLLAPVT